MKLKLWDDSGRPIAKSKGDIKNLSKDFEKWLDKFR